MDNWRRQKGDSYNHRRRHQQQQQQQEEEGQGQGDMRSHNRKPPQPHSSWQPTVPSWEKRFCTSVGSVPWRKLLETKRSMYLYENVVQWNDSAVEEAFHNAKSRFWAEINDLPCDISLPDPDIYIDEIDWNSDIDPELLLDLEREPKATEDVDKDKKVVILNSALLLNQSFFCTGWGDAEQDIKKDTGFCEAPNHGGFTQNTGTGNCENLWERNCAPGSEAIKYDGWGSCLNNSSGWNQHDNHYSEWRNMNSRSGDWEIYDGNRKREGTGRDMSRYKTSRFNGVDRGWKGRREYKRSDFACERPFPNEKNSSSQWNSMNSCGPICHNGFDKAGLSWGWEKQVL